MYQTLPLWLSFTCSIITILTFFYTVKTPDISMKHDKIIKNNYYFTYFTAKCDTAHLKSRTDPVHWVILIVASSSTFTISQALNRKNQFIITHRSYYKKEAWIYCPSHPDYFHGYKLEPSRAQTGFGFPDRCVWKQCLYEREHFNINVTHSSPKPSLYYTNIRWEVAQRLKNEQRTLS